MTPCAATRLGISVSLVRLKGMTVVGEAPKAEEALNLNDEQCPDLVILDIELEEEKEGLSLCKLLKESSHNRPQVLVYTAHNAEGGSCGGGLVGADGYLHKTVDCVKIPETVSKMLGGSGLWVLGPSTAEFRTQFEELIEEADLPDEEKEVLTLLLRRYTNGEIAEQLSSSCNTIKHVSSVLRKLGFGSQQEIVRAASSKKYGEKIALVR